MLIAGWLAAAAAWAAPAQAQAPAQVPCWASGGGHFTCFWYPAGDGRSGGTPVLDGTGRGSAGCTAARTGSSASSAAGALDSGPYWNSWWGWTLTDYNGRWGWANAVHARGGDNDGGFGGGTPPCNGAHGNPPGGAARPGSAAAASDREPDPDPVPPPVALIATSFAERVTGRGSG